MIARLLTLLITLALVALPARAQLPDGLFFDDGFTWIECQNKSALVDNVSVGSWVPVMNLRLFGKVPDRSGWKVVVKQDGKSIAEYMNDGFPVQLAGGESQGMLIVGWWKPEPQLTVTGVLDFEVYYIDGATDKEHLAKTLKVDVRKVDRVRGGVRQREPDSAQFFVNRHAEILSTILYFRDTEYPSYTQFNGATYYSDRVVELILNYSENEKFEGPKLGRIKVEVDGKPIEMKVPNNKVMQDEMGFGEQVGKFNVMHSDRNAKKFFEGGPAYQETVGFSRRSMVLPLHWGPKPSDGRPPSKVYTNDHPGEWKITYLIDRKPVRIWRFTIGPDGLPVPHAEQGRGLKLAKNAVLIETEIPDTGAHFDGRLTSEFVKSGAFFGRPWETDSMKALAEKVPTKSTPFPTPTKLDE
jgi:hypothetical protein